MYSRSLAPLQRDWLEFVHGISALSFAARRWSICSRPGRFGGALEWSHHPDDDCSLPRMDAKTQQKKYMSVLY